MSARASRSSPSSGSSRNLPTRTAPGPQTASVVPGVGQAGRVGAEDLVGHGQLEVQHPVGDGERDRGSCPKLYGACRSGHSCRACRRRQDVLQSINSSSGRSSWDRVSTVAVFGAYGHTGRFVVAELRERGFVPLLARPRRGQAAGAGGVPAGARGPAGVGRRPGLARPRAGRRGRGDQLRRPVRRDRRPGDRGGTARRDPVRGRGGRDRGQPRHVRALRRPRPRRGRRGGPGDGLLRRPRRPAGHDGDGRLDGGRRGAHRVRPEQLAPHGRDARRGHGLPASGATAGGSATPAARLEYRDDAPADPGVGLPRRRSAPGPSSASSRWPTSSPSPATCPSPRCART